MSPSMPPSTPEPEIIASCSAEAERTRTPSSRLRRAALLLAHEQPLTTDEAAGLIITSEVLRLAQAGESFSLVPPSLLRKLMQGPSPLAVELCASLTFVVALERYCSERRAMFPGEESGLTALLADLNRYCRRHGVRDCGCESLAGGFAPHGPRRYRVELSGREEDARGPQRQWPRPRCGSLPRLVLPPTAGAANPSRRASCPTPVGVFAIDLDEDEAEGPSVVDSPLLAAAARLCLSLDQPRSCTPVSSSDEEEGGYGPSAVPPPTADARRPALCRPIPIPRPGPSKFLHVSF